VRATPRRGRFGLLHCDRVAARRLGVNKRDVLQLLEGMPDEIDPDELMYRIFVLRKLQAAENDYEQGRFVSHEEFVRRSNAWRNKAAAPTHAGSPNG
jgi:hypothetical protein